MIYKCMYCNFNAVHDSKCEGHFNVNQFMEITNDLMYHFWVIAFSMAWGQIGLASANYEGSYSKIANVLATCVEELTA